MVLGLGRSGFAVSKLLINAGAKVAALDAKVENELTADLNELRRIGAKVYAGENNLSQIPGRELVVVSPGIPLEHPWIREAKRRGIPVMSELEIAFGFCRNPLIAVTGTNGKSTTTALITHILNTAGAASVAAGNIGMPFSSVVPAEDRTIVVEVSSYQLETIDAFKPRIAVWLNLTADHLGRHGSIASYARMKTRIFRNQTADDTLIFNADDKLVKEHSASARSEPFPFSFQGHTGTFIKNDCIEVDWKGIKDKICPLDKLKIRGRHNLENALAAAAAACAYGIEPRLISEGLQSFAGLEHRQELVIIHNGVTFTNDSKATNLNSTLKALETIETPIILIAGGRGKGESFTPAADLIRRKVKLLITMGEAAEQLERELSGAVETMFARDMKNALEIARKYASPGDTILLSPMCASFDMYRDFEERGRVFKSMVRELTDA